MENNLWWWNLTIGNLQSNKTHMINEETTCEDVIKMFHELKFHHMTIMNANQEIVGFITENLLLSNFILGKVQKTERIDKIMIKEFRKVNLKTTLGKLSRFFEHENYVVVVNENKNDKLVGVLTPIDLLNFINNSKNGVTS